MLTFAKRQIIFSQEDTADAVFYIQEGQVKLSVVPQQGKEAIVAILERAAIFGESCLARLSCGCISSRTSVKLPAENSSNMSNCEQIESIQLDMFTVNIHTNGRVSKGGNHAIFRYDGARVSHGSCRWLFNIQQSDGF